MFALDTEHLELQSAFREFSVNEVRPIAKEIDETGRFPAETVSKLADMGMMGLPFPEEYGGSGTDQLAYVLAVEEIAKSCASTAIIMSAHTSLCSWPIFKFGTEEQKRKYLVPLAGGKLLGAFALTEPSAGTDASMQKTTAVLDGDSYILNGSKIFITNAAVADVFVIFAMTDREKGSKGISAFILEKGMEGFSVGKPEKKMGLHASSTCELIFDNVRVPAENRIDEEGKGFKIAMAALDGGRIGIAAQAVGIAQGAIDEAVKYTCERVQFGSRISQFQNTQFTLADMQTRTDAARLLLWRAAAAMDSGERYSHLAAMAKLFAAENASYVTNRAVQLFGGYGYCGDYPVERMMRDAKITEIYEGTSEVQKMVISGFMGVK